MNWFASLMSSNDYRVCPIVALGFLVGVAFVAFAGYQLYMDIHTFSPTGYGAGAAAVITAVAGGKTGRDYFAPPVALPDDPAPPAGIDHSKRSA